MNEAMINKVEVPYVQYVQFDSLCQDVQYVQ